MNWIRQADDEINDCKVFRAGAFLVLVADSETKEYALTKRMHLSISHPLRYPKWDEIADAYEDRQSSRAELERTRS